MRTRSLARLGAPPAGGDGGELGAQAERGAKPLSSDPDGGLDAVAPETGRSRPRSRAPKLDTGDGTRGRPRRSLGQTAHHIPLCARFPRYEAFFSPLPYNWVACRTPGMTFLSWRLAKNPA